MYVNAKMISFDTVPAMGGGVKGENSNMIYLIHCKILCQCYNVSTPSTTIKKEKKCHELTLFFFFFLFWFYWGLNSELVLVRQVYYHLSHALRPKDLFSCSLKSSCEPGFLMWYIFQK
jgi:hypothetical protein